MRLSGIAPEFKGTGNLSSKCSECGRAPLGGGWVSYPLQLGTSKNLTLKYLGWTKGIEIVLNNSQQILGTGYYSTMVPIRTTQSLGRGGIRGPDKLTIRLEYT